MSSPPNARLKPWLLVGGKLVVAGLVVWFVWGAVREAAAQLSMQQVRPDAAMLGLSGVVYLLGLAPMAWFWRRTLRDLGQPCAWRDVLPAYYLGHLGKYVPGKALVIVLRTGAIRAAGGEAAPIAASVFVETLTLMATGGAIASLLLVTLPSGDEREPWHAVLAIALAVVAVAPTLPPVMAALMRRLKPDSAAAVRGVTWRLLATGWASAALTWAALAGSLWLAIRSLDVEFPFTPAVAVRCLLAVSLPVVAGFLSLIPGGLLVRDGLMFALLKPLSGLAEPVALAATILLRLIWVVAEGIACVMLAVGRRWMD